MGIEEGYAQPERAHVPRNAGRPEGYGQDHNYSLVRIRNSGQVQLALEPEGTTHILAFSIGMPDIARHTIKLESR